MSSTNQNYDQQTSKPVKAAASQTVSEIISRHTYWAVATGMIPIPVVDIAAVTAIQLDMLKQLSTYYDLDYSEVQGKSWIGALTASTMSSILARLGASAIKTIPVVGTVLGVTSMAILSGASTYAIGQVFMTHFEDGGSLMDFEADKFKQYYEEKMKEGKNYAKEFTEKFKKEVEQDDNRGVSKRLEELASMHKAELISDEEYAALRKEILNDFATGV